MIEYYKNKIKINSRKPNYRKIRVTMKLTLKNAASPPIQPKDDRILPSIVLLVFMQIFGKSVTRSHYSGSRKPYRAGSTKYHVLESFENRLLNKRASVTEIQIIA